MAWELVLDRKLNQDYRGSAEICDYTFTVPLPDQLGAKWLAQQFVDAHVEELLKQNSQLLELKLWEDKLSGTFETDYYVRVVATASPLYWNVIIIALLVVLALEVITWAIIQVRKTVEYIGEKSPITLPLMALAAIGIITIVGIYVVRRA